MTSEQALDRQPARGNQARRARQYLTAIAASLNGHGITSRVTRLGGTPVLTIEEPAAGPNPATITIDPDLSTGHALAMDCTCIWTPAPGATPEATATTILTVLNAVRSASSDKPADDC
jgi:hypothetical protein